MQVSSHGAKLFKVQESLKQVKTEFDFGDKDYKTWTERRKQSLIVVIQVCSKKNKSTSISVYIAYYGPFLFRF